MTLGCSQASKVVFCQHKYDLKSRIKNSLEHKQLSAVEGKRHLKGERKKKLCPTSGFVMKFQQPFERMKLKFIYITLHHVSCLSVNFTSFIPHSHSRVSSNFISFFFQLALLEFFPSMKMMKIYILLVQTRQILLERDTFHPTNSTSNEIHEFTMRR